VVQHNGTMNRGAARVVGRGWYPTPGPASTPRAADDARRAQLAAAGGLRTLDVTLLRLRFVAAYAKRAGNSPCTAR
jgi:hypothetical protein